jgi:hypothetical protein
MQTKPVLGPMQKRLTLSVVCLMLLSSCTTVPVKIKFPEVPQELRESCPPLAQVNPQDHQLSSLLEVVVANYAQYYECKNRADGWGQWYNEQKKIYENIGK